MSLHTRFARHLAESDHRLRNMSRMMEAVGVDVREFSLRRDGYDLIDAIRSCRSCRAADTCSDWLRREPGSAEGASFCPNEDRFLRAR